ncbi:alkaline phosphatase family protein [Rhodanobacter sp. DHG33]|uniref:alkaline phosphatase family protein n=1 Tax=Rhodanobacter sp. DHG33 TaxID=2775921 RepID=UPI00177BE8AB|nr:alkaline phosphatase family protein [Rhodanobacter sp. DHG33]MBD8897510.1 alkaline phosphatase family protein [Rhodanobacter sp. DHG33]
MSSSRFGWRAVAAATLAVGIATTAAGARAADAPRPKVVVISLDAFGARSLAEPELPAPTLHALMQQGVHAVSMQPINPTITWPNHTAMVTGDDASLHHVLVNGLIVGQREATPPHIDMNAPKSKLVAVPTVYDAAHAAGLVTAEVDWVAIMDAPTIDWRFPEKPNPDGAIEQDLVKQGIVTRDELAKFGEPSQAWRDRMYTNAAVDIIRKHHPDLLLLHLLALDSIEHETGYGNDSGRNTIAFLDDRVKEVIDAVRAAGELDNTTFVIVSDHGQESVHHLLNPNVPLIDAGLQTASASQSAFAIPEGGFALVFQKNATDASRQALKKLFAGKAGIRAALTPDEAAKMGWPVPATSDQAPDLLLYPANDYEFDDKYATQYDAPTLQRGAHGYPNSEPLMQAIFIAAGAGIQGKGVQIPAFPNVDVAPTIAHLLHIRFDDAKGKPLTGILAPGY